MFTASAAHAFAIGPAAGLNCDIIIPVPPFVLPCTITEYLQQPAPVIGAPYEEVHQKITKDWLTPLTFTPSGRPAITFSSEALLEIADGNAFTDYNQGSHANHFDNNYFPHAAWLLITARDQILSRLRTSEPTAAHAAITRRLLGTNLHTIQDFFSHSTWVNGTPSIETLPTFGTGPIPGPGVGNPCTVPPVIQLLSFHPYTGELVSSGAGQPLASGFAGGVPYMQSGIAPYGECAHGFLGTGIHKDWIGRPDHEEAIAWAGVATAKFVQGIIDEPNNNPHAVCMLMTDNVCPVGAPTTYTYSGNQFLYIGGCCGVSHVSGSFTVPSALAPNTTYNNLASIITTYSFTDGRYTWSPSNYPGGPVSPFNISNQFFVRTDASGEIVSWRIDLVSNNPVGEIFTQSLDLAVGGDRIDWVNVFNNYVAYSFAPGNPNGQRGVPGTWH